MQLEEKKVLIQETTRRNSVRKNKTWVAHRKSAYSNNSRSYSKPNLGLSFDTLSSSGDEEDEELRRAMLVEELGKYVKKAKNSIEGRAENLDNLKQKIREVTNTRVFKEVSSLGGLQEPGQLLLSKDNKLMAAVLSNYSMGIFRRDPLTGFFYLDHQVKGPTNTTYSFTFNHDESMIIIASSDASVRILKKDEATDRFYLHKTIMAHKEWTRDVCISQDDQMLVTGGSDKLIKIWQLDIESDEYKLKQTIEAHDDIVFTLAVSNDSKMIISGSFDKKIKIWKKKEDSGLFSLHQTIEEHNNKIRVVRISEDTNRLYAGSDDQSITIWQRGGIFSKFGLIQKLKGKEGEKFYVKSLMLSPDEKMIVTASEDHFVRIWKKHHQTKKYTLHQKIEAHASMTVVAVLSHDTHFIISGSTRQDLKVWRRSNLWSNFEHFQTIGCHKNTVCSIALSKDGRTLVSGSDDKTVKVWKKVGGHGFAFSQDLKGHQDEVWKVKIVKNRGLIVSASKDKTVILWKKKGHSEKYEHWKTLKDHRRSVTEIELSSDARILVSGSIDRSLMIRRLQIKQVPKKQEEDEEEKDFVFNSKETLTKEDPDDLSLELKHQVTQEEDYELVQTLKGHRKPISGISLSRDARTMASSSMGGAIFIWRLAENSQNFLLFQQIQGHSRSVFGLKINSTGDLIASLSTDRTLKIWKAALDRLNPRQFSLHQSMQAHNKNPTRLDMDDKGTMIVSGGNDDRAIVWLRDEESNLFQSHQVLSGHLDPIQQTLISQDRKTIFSCSTDQSIKIWSRENDLNTKLVVKKKWLEEKDFSCIASNQEGSLLCSAGTKYLKIYQKPDPLPEDLVLKPLQITGGHIQDVFSVKLSTDTKTGVSGSFDNFLIVWKIDESIGSLRVDQFLEGHTEKVWSVDFSDESGTIISGSGDSTVRVWSRNSNTKQYESDQCLQGHQSAVHCVALSQDETMIASGSEDMTIMIWKKEVGRRKKFRLANTLKGHEGKIYGLTFSSDGKFIVSGSEDLTTKIWVRPYPGTDYKLDQTLKEHTGLVRSVSVSQNRLTLVTSSEDKKTIVWTRSQVDHQFSFLQRLEDHMNKVYEAKISISGLMIVSVSQDSRVNVYKLNKRMGLFERDQEIQINNYFLKTIDLSRDEDKIFFAGNKGDLFMYKRDSPEEKFKEICKSSWHKQQIKDIKMNNKGDMIVTASRDLCMRVWVKDEKLDSFVYQQILTGHSNTVKSVIFNEDETGLISGALDKTIRIWKKDVETKKFSLVQTLEKHTGYLKTLALTKDGGLLISGAVDQTIRLWTKNNPKSDRYSEFQVLKGHKDGILAVCVSEDGSKIFSSSSDKTVRIWTRDHNSDLFAENQVLEGHESDVNAVSMIKNGNIILSGSTDQTLRMWRLDTHGYHLVGYYKLEHWCSQILTFGSHFIVGHPTYGSSVALTSSPKKHYFSAFSEKYRFSSILNKAFSEYDQKELLSILLNQFPRYKEEQEEKNAEELIRLHTEINPLFWFCLLESPNYLRKALEVWQYEHWVYEQCREFDPFAYSFEIGNQELITTWADYFNNNPDRLSVKDLDSFNKLISCNNSDMQSFAISQLKINSPLSKGIDPIVQYPIREDRGFSAIKSNQAIMSSKIQQEFKQRQDNSKPGIKVTGHSTCIGLSPDLSRLLTFIQRVENLTAENKMKLRPILISYFKMYRPAFMIYSGFSLLAKIFLFMIVIFQVQDWFYVIPFFIIYSIMLFYEFVDIYYKGFGYFKSIYNLLDIMLYPSAMALVKYVLANKYEFLENQFNNFMVFFVLYVALTRAVSMLRVFDANRYLILMILRVYFDMTPFFIVLTSYLVGTASLNILISRTDTQHIGDNRDQLSLEKLRLSIDTIYNWGYGNWENTQEMNALTFWFYIHSGIFIGLMMYNLLIAIISGTYEKFEQERMLVDLDDVIEMLIEMAEFLNVFRIIRDRLFGVIKKKSIYFHFLIPAEKDGEVKELLDEFKELRYQVERGQEQGANIAKSSQAESLRNQEEIKSLKIDLKRKDEQITTLQKQFKRSQEDIELIREDIKSIKEDLGKNQEEVMQKMEMIFELVKNKLSKE